MGGWSGLDIVIAGILVISALMSFLRGFVRELISLAASVIGIVAALWFCADAAAWFEPFTKNHSVALLAAFLAILVAAIVAGGIVSAIAGRMVKAAGLRGTDRLLGASFGLVKGLLVSLALVLALVAFPPGREIAERSRLAPYLVYGSRALAAGAPQAIRDGFSEGWQKLKQMPMPPAKFGQGQSFLGGN